MSRSITDDNRGDFTAHIHIHARVDIDIESRVFTSRQIIIRSITKACKKYVYIYIYILHFNGVICDEYEKKGPYRITVFLICAAIRIVKYHR